MHHTSSSTQQDHVSNFRQDPVPLCMAKKWLPVSHRHGCAIYRHDNVSAEQQDLVGGEIMVSAIIKGSPEQCLAALTSSNSSNSILGPATAVEVLQQSADGSRKVLEIHLEHPCSRSPPTNSHNTPSTTTTGTSSSSAQRRKPGSYLTRLCCRLLRRRCAVVHQTLWQDPRGIYCITFHSLTPEEQQQQQQVPQPQHQLDVQHAASTNSTSFSSSGVVHSHSNGNTLPATGSRSLPGSSCESCAVHNQQQQHHQQQEQQHTQHQQQQQQQLRHRGVSAPGHLSAKKQASQALQLHACCHQHSSGDGSSNNSTNRQLLLNKDNQQSHSSQQYHQQQQQQQGQAVVVSLALQPLYLLLSWLGSLLLLLRSLLGFPCSSSSSSSSTCCGLLGPVRVSVVGGFTVAGLDGGDSGGAAAETLVTSILKVNLGGCLASSAPGSCSLVCSAAVRVGVVDTFVNQMLSGAVERVKAEVEHPPTVQQQQQQQRQQGVAAASDAAWLEGVVSNVTSVASMALAPLTTWLQGQRPQQQQRHKHHLQQQHSQGKADHRHHHHQKQQQHQQVSAGRSSSVGGTRSSGGGRKNAAAAAVVQDARAAAAVGSSGGAGRLVDDLVGLDQQGNRLTGLCNPAFWSPLHQPGCPALFQVRGPTYLSDHHKVAAGDSAYTLLSVDLVSTPTAVHHLARFLPSVRRCHAASAFVINMMVPAANDVMNLVMTFGSSRPWPAQCSSTSSSGSSRSNTAGSSSGSSSDGGSNDSSSSDGSSSSSLGRSGFENTLRRFLQSDNTGRSNMFKMIPHIEFGPWVLQTMVGTTPVIMGRKLETTYHLTERYMEVDIDVTTCRTAGYIVQSIRGATTSLVVDLCYLLEGQRPKELPEELIGAVRFSNIDMSATTPLDVSTEIPSWPQPW